MYTSLFLLFVHIMAIVVWSLMAYISETKTMRNLNVACSVIWGLCAIGDIVQMIQMSSMY